MKSILVLIDGLADIDVGEGKTPLTIAKTPNMDKLCASGICGLIDPVEPGLACGSDTAHLSILGYDPFEYYAGRGTFECIGVGIHMESGDIAFKSNFAYMDEQSGVVVKRRVDKNFSNEAKSLCEGLRDIKLESYPEHIVNIYHDRGHRCVIHIHGPNLSNEITDTDPGRDNLKLMICQPRISDQNAVFTAKFVNELNEFLMNYLKNHKVNEQRREQNKSEANVILFRGAGLLKKV